LGYYAAAAVDLAGGFRPVARLRERIVAWRGWELEGEPPDGLPVPPARLRVLVAGTGDPDRFLQLSEEAGAQIRSALDEARVPLAGTVLDFGCGCGRLARQWADAGLDLHGCDYNPELVAWCRENLPFMQARVNRLEPPSPYDADSFDLIYAISILTHLTEPVAHAWMREWARILKPGGALLFTTHGDAYRHELGKKARPRYDAGDMVVRKARIEGLNACVANHPHRYVADRLLDGFELRAFRPGPSDTFLQDIYVARRTR
jgi:SAM-dependent methyltransferase